MSETNNLPRIKKLSSSLANQIAAGEVIERPASVIKELLENCLDAGASQIVIDVSKAGTQLIRVSDNGCGIHPEDLQLALERHATAKLDNQSDLAAIKSLGFRGEALPSISSVAELSITSRIESLEQAATLIFDPASGESTFRPAAHPVGTTVEVKNLFHNTPARRKFLSSERTEFLHILEMVRRIALSCSAANIELRHNGQKVLSCRAQPEDLDGRVANLIGQSFINKAIALDYAAGDMQIRGWLGIGDLARSSTDKQYLYLNGRMIRDKRLNHAIRLACEGQIAEGRFPSYVLYLSLDLAAADVNVHPTKHEVRFRHARDVHDFFYAALSTAIEKDQNLYSTTEPEVREKEQYVSAVNEESQYSQRHNIAGEVRSNYGDLNANRQTELIRDIPALGKPLLQIQENYLLTQRDDVTLLINIEQAKKYIAKEKLSLSEDKASITSRPLLVPIRFSITADQENVLGTLKSQLEKYALNLELAGPSTCMVRAIPSVLENADIEMLVNDILNMNVSDVSDQLNCESIISIMINHVCDIATLFMSIDEMLNLLRQVEATGIDVKQLRYASVWRTLNTDDLDKLMKLDD
jgi:DNA mismatch repair protein MutL